MLITISREFGSGGRELGKRLSDALGIPCYDNEIIAMIAKEHGLDEGFVSEVSEKRIQAAYPMTIGRRFTMTSSPAAKQAIAVAVEQQKIIEDLAKQGDCIIVGRCADAILKDYHTMNLFVYADKKAKLKRCMDRAPEGENLTVSQLERKIREIDRERARKHDLVADFKWGVKENYHLCVNTTGVEIKKLVPVLAEYIKVWFEGNRG